LFSLSARHNYIHALSTSLGGQVNGEVRYAPLQGKLHTLHLSNNAMRKVGLFIIYFYMFQVAFDAILGLFRHFFFGVVPVQQRDAAGPKHDGIYTYS
jgi:hypothetical protein